MTAKVLLTVVLAAAALAPAWAQEGPMGAMLAGPGGGGDSVRFRFEDAFGASGAPTITDYRLDAGVVVSSSPRDNWSSRERFGHFGLNGLAQIPDGGPAVPRSLWSEETGVRYARQMEAGRAWGASVSAGSDSDRLFNSIHETAFQATLDAKVPSGERNAWLFFLSYSNHRYFANGIPLPGVAYQFVSQSGKLRGIVGFPFAALFWAPAPGWDAKVSAFGPRRMSADAGYRFAGPLRLHGGFDWGGQEWLRAGRANNRDALVFERKRLYAGIETPLPLRLMLDLSGGRQFDQRFYEGHGFSATGSKATLPPGWYLSSTLNWRFGPRPEPRASAR